MRSGGNLGSERVLNASGQRSSAPIRIYLLTSIWTLSSPTAAIVKFSVS